MDPKSIRETTWVYQTYLDKNKKTKKVVKAFFGLILFLLLILAVSISFENISDYYESKAIKIKMERENSELKSLENFALLAEIDDKNQIQNDETEISFERAQRIKRQDLQLDRTVYYKVRKHKKKPSINKHKNIKRIRHHVNNKQTKSKKNKEIKKKKSKKFKKLHQKQYKKLKDNEIERKNEYSYERPKKYYHYSNPYYKVFNKENFYKPEDKTKTTFNLTILPEHRPYNFPNSTTSIKKKTSIKATNVGTSTTKAIVSTKIKIKQKPKPKYTTPRIKTRKTSTKPTTVSKTSLKITTSRQKTTPTTTKHATKHTHTTKKKTTATTESKTSIKHTKYKQKSTEENEHPIPIVLKLSALHQLRELLSEHIDKITKNETTLNDSSFSETTKTATLPSTTIVIQTTVSTTTISSTTTTDPPIHIYVDLFT